jgi:AAA family ATP:ADP antiporter
VLKQSANMAKTQSAGDLVKSLFSVRKGERLLVALMFLWFALFISSYYIMRGVRRGLVLQDLGADSLPVIYMGAPAVLAVVVWIYSHFAHAPRKVLISSIMGIFLVNQLAWWWILGQGVAWASGVFWIWLDAYSIIGVTIFWMYANDVFSSESAKRLFGIIGAGGGFGAIVGSFITASLVENVGSVNMILFAAAMIVTAIGAFLFAERITQGRSGSKAKSMEQAAISGLGGVLKTISSSRFLTFLLSLVVLERMLPVFVDFIYSATLEEIASGADQIAALDATLETWRSFAELFIQLVVTAAMLRFFGPRFALVSLAVIYIAGTLVYVVVPVVMTALALKHVEEAVRHTWFKAGKEVTYTVTSREVLYKIKPYIEMFFYRLAQGAAGLILLLLANVLDLALWVVALVAFVAAGFFAYAGWRLSGEFERLEHEAGRNTPRAAAS